MKSTFAFVAIMLALVCASQANAQFRRSASEEPTAAQSFVHPEMSETWLGFFHPENFSMHQSYSMSYSAMGSQGIALGRFTNSMMYKFSDKIDARVDVSLQHSPYSTFDKSITNSLTGLMVDRAELNYRPSENMFLRISYRKLPSYYGYGYNGYNSPYLMGYPGYFDEGF